jgi:hypothetical protein
MYGEYVCQNQTLQSTITTSPCQAELTQVQLLVTLQSIVFLQVFLSIRNTENSWIRIKRPSSMSSRVDVVQHVSHPRGK